MPRLHFSKDKFTIQKGKHKLSEYKLRDLVTNGIVDLGRLFPKLEKVAGNVGLTTLQLSLTDSLLRTHGKSDFIGKGNKILQDLKIVFTPALMKIENDSDKLKIMRKYHDDPLCGGHPGITRMLRKIRLKYHWKGMTRDITRYIRKCD